MTRTAGTEPEASGRGFVGVDGNTAAPFEGRRHSGPGAELVGL